MLGEIDVRVCVSVEVVDYPFLHDFRISFSGILGKFLGRNFKFDLDWLQNDNKFGSNLCTTSLARMTNS